MRFANNTKLHLHKKSLLFSVQQEKLALCVWKTIYLLLLTLAGRVSEFCNKKCNRANGKVWKTPGKAPRPRHPLVDVLFRRKSTVLHDLIKTHVQESVVWNVTRHPTQASSNITVPFHTNML